MRDGLKKKYSKNIRNIDGFVEGYLKHILPKKLFFALSRSGIIRQLIDQLKLSKIFNVDCKNLGDASLDHFGRQKFNCNKKNLDAFVSDFNTAFIFLLYTRDVRDTQEFGWFSAQFKTNGDVTCAQKSKKMAKVTEDIKQLCIKGLKYNAMKDWQDSS